MKPHKWAKEIKAWADGAEIEKTWTGFHSWTIVEIPEWQDKTLTFRIKPQHKKPQYLYVYKEPKSDSFGAKQNVFITTETGLYFGCKPIGKIKLEDETSSSKEEQ